MTGKGTSQLIIFCLSNYYFTSEHWQQLRINWIKRRRSNRHFHFFKANRKNNVALVAVMSHELGHALGMPDVPYNTKCSSGSCVMNQYLRWDLVICRFNPHAGHIPRLSVQLPPGAVREATNWCFSLTSMFSPLPLSFSFSSFFSL